jgi:hypothetical protein
MSQCVFINSGRGKDMRAILFIFFCLSFGISGKCKDCVKIRFLKPLSLSHTHNADRILPFLLQEGKPPVYCKNQSAERPIPRRKDFDSQIKLYINFASLAESPFWSTSITIEPGREFILCDSHNIRNNEKGSYGGKRRLSYYSWELKRPDWERAMSKQQEQSWILGLVSTAYANNDFDLYSLKEFKIAALRRVFGDTASIELMNF